MEVREVIEQFVGYIVPIIALIISIFSYYESRKINKVQLRLNEMEEQLKIYELEEKEKERKAANESKVGARIYNISKGKYKLKIWNSGQTTIYNVNFELPEELQNLVSRDKVPFEVLEPGQSFEEHVIVYMGSPRKFPLNITWKDEIGNKIVKDQIVSF